MMTDKYISYKTAKLLKHKGFEMDGLTVYNVFKGHMYEIEGVQSEMFKADEDVTIPTIYSAMQWLREEHNILIVVDRAPDFYYWELEDNTTGEDIEGYGEAPTYEEACEMAINYALTKINNETQMD